MFEFIVHKQRFTAYQYVKTIPSQNRAAVVLPLPSHVIKKIGLSCIVLSLIGIFLVSTPILLAESIAFLQRAQNRVNVLAQVSVPASPSPVPTPVVTPVPTPDPASLPFSITIPKIDLNSQVISNVDAGNPDVYKAALKNGVAHGLGSGFPGQGKMVYIFGHSTDYVWNVEVYNALFYQVKDLEAGDTVTLTLGDNDTTYKVTQKYIVAADDLAVIEENQHRDVLILVTCYPPGTTWKRLLVLAEPIS